MDNQQISPQIHPNYVVPETESMPKDGRLRTAFILNLVTLVLCILFSVIFGFVLLLSASFSKYPLPVLFLMVAILFILPLTLTLKTFSIYKRNIGNSLALGVTNLVFGILLAGSLISIPALIAGILLLNARRQSLVNS
jgi:hypothetical protein